MATPSVLTFDAEGRAVDFEVWLDDLQLFLQCDRADGLSLFDLTSGLSPAPPATAAQRSGSGGGQRQQQQRSPETPSPQQLHEWYAGRQRGGGAGPCTYVLRTGDRTGEQCGGPHSTQRCFGRLTDAWRHQFPDATEIPRWGDLSRAGVAVFDLDYDAILAAMYALSTSDEGDCYLCVPPDPGIEAAALGAGETAALGASVSAAPGAGESAPSGTASAQVFHTFTLDSGASRSFFRDRTTLTPLSRPVAVSLVDPSGGPVLASFSTVLLCPAAPSGSLSGLYLPSFSTNLVSGADLQDQGVDQFTPASQRVTHCTDARTGRHLATFTRRPGSSLYTLSPESPPVSASGQVAASSQVLAAASGSRPESAPCSCRLLSHLTLLWHHRLGHPSLPRLRGMASRVLVSGLPRSLPPLPPGPALTCVPCVEGRQRAAPHSSEFPPTEDPLQTLHMDDVTFDESVPYYRLFPYRTASLPPPPLFLAPGPPPVDPLPPQGPAPSGVSQVDAVEPVKVAVDSGAAPGAEPAGAGSGGAGSGGVESGGAETWGAEPGGAEPGGAATGGAEPGVTEPGGAEPGGAGSARVASGGASSRREVLSPRELREWFAQRWSRAAGAGVAGVGPTGGSAGVSGGTGAAGSAGPAAVGATGVGAAGGSADAGPSKEAGAGAAGAGGSTGAGAPAGSPGAVPAGSGGASRPRPYFVLLLEQVLGLPPSPSPAPPLECPQPVQSQSLLQPVSPLPAPSPYSGPTGGLAERRALACALSTDVLEDRQEDFQCFAAALPHLAAMDAEMASWKSTGTYVDEVPLPGANIISGMWIFRVKRPPGSPPVFKARYVARGFTLPLDESVEPSGPYPELVGCLMYLMTCTRPDLAYPLSILARYVAPGRHRPEHMAAAKRVLRYLCSTSGMGLVLGGRRPVVLTGHADASWADDQATQRSSQGYTFSLGSGSVSWWSTRSSSVLSSSCEAEIYAGAMAAQELRWLTYLLTDLGEQPRSPPVLYVDNKVMLALCREHRLEHRTKHIALRYFLARELQQRGQLRLAYVASEANTADIFTKTLAPGDHQRFCTLLGLVPTWPHLLTS
ncbi:unnamed protein product [Closterium sp. NIES-54]